jgi:hypothetical protein
MIGLTDTQLRIIMGAARLVPVEKRDTFRKTKRPSKEKGGASKEKTAMNFDDDPRQHAPERQLIEQVSMSGSNSIIPITDEQAKLGTKALETLQGVAGFLREIFGTVPEDLIGILGGDWLKVKRVENICRTISKAHERLEKDGIKPQAASLSISVPLLKAAADESRDELQDLWASLLAAAADPNRSKFFRIEFIEVIKKMDPLDTLVLVAMGEGQPRVDGATQDRIREKLGVSRDAFHVSIDHLTKLNLLRKESGWSALTAFGRELLRTLKLTQQ